MESKSKPVSELVTEVIASILLLVGALIFYIWLVNSSWSMSGTFDFIRFRWPFEKTGHYCARVSRGIISSDTEKYYDCMFDNGTVDEALAAWWRKQGVYDEDTAKCAADVTKKYLTDSEIETVLDGGKIDRIPDLKGMLDDLNVCDQ